MRPNVWLNIPFVLATMAVGAAEIVPPHLTTEGRADYARYQAAAGHKAFALAPGGSWAWVADAASADAAQTGALARCVEQTEQSCVLFAVDQRLVFDARRWPTLWALPEPAQDAAVGLMRGARFPELVFYGSDGAKRVLSEWRGQVVVLHFWGSWCPPCRRELPDMAAQAKKLGGHRVAFIPLQVRESIASSRRWVIEQRISLALFDSGMSGRDDGFLQIAGGGRLPDRAVAPVFPSTVVLDRQGRVVFVHRGPIDSWADYAPFLIALTR